MEYRRLGKAGVKVSLFSFGSWVTINGKTDEDLVLEMLKTSIEAGVNFIDTAEGYGSGEAEIQLGKALKKGGFNRQELVISTKIFFGAGGVKGPNAKGLSHKHVIEGLNASLKRLDLEYVDVVFAHRPDYETPIEETVRAFTQIINQGKAFYWGTSEWSANQIQEAYSIARREHLVPPVVEQPQYNLFTRERVEKEYSPLYPPNEIGLGTTIWSPLAYGLLTGKYNNGIPEGTRLTQDFFKDTAKSLSEEVGKQKIEKVKALTEIATELGASVSQVALAWCAKNPAVSTVILGASSIAQLKENLGAVAVVPKLTPEVLERIEQIFGNKPEPNRKYR